MLTTLVGILFLIVCILLIGIVLLQRGRGGGLSGAFGGAGGHSAFGAKTGDVFTWVTVALTAVFLILAVVSNYIFVPEQFQGPSANPPAAEMPAAPSPTTQQNQTK
jgi:preprotein translocase subunit SecG